MKETNEQDINDKFEDANVKEDLIEDEKFKI